jgi:tellurite resistance protein TehA-like permease
MSSHPISTLERINAVQLLPVVAPIVACGTGAKIAKILPNLDHALGTTVTCYILWGMSVPLAMMILVIYYHRLALHKLPAREVIVSCFLPLGPLGFGGFSIMLLGSVARTLFPETGFLHPAAGDTVYILGFFLALLMWGFGLVWLIFALATIWKSRPFPFNMGWWGFTFPLGVYSASTIQLGTEMPSIVFRVLGTVSRGSA